MVGKVINRNVVILNSNESLDVISFYTREGLIKESSFTPLVLVTQALLEKTNLMNRHLKMSLRKLAVAISMQVTEINWCKSTMS